MARCWLQPRQGCKLSSGRQARRRVGPDGLLDQEGHQGLGAQELTVALLLHDLRRAAEVAGLGGLARAEADRRAALATARAAHLEAEPALGVERQTVFEVALDHGVELRLAIERRHVLGGAAVSERCSPASRSRSARTS